MGTEVSLGSPRTMCPLGSGREKEPSSARGGEWQARTPATGALLVLAPSGPFLPGALLSVKGSVLWLEPEGTGEKLVPLRLWVACLHSKQPSRSTWVRVVRWQEEWPETPQDLRGQKQGVSSRLLSRQWPPGARGSVPGRAGGAGG